MRKTILLSLLLTGASTSAFAQNNAPAPSQQSVDANGVDLFLGTYNVSRNDLSIGSRELGISYERYWRQSFWTDNSNIHISVAGNRWTVSIGNFAEDFILQNNAFYNAQGSSSQLSSTSSSYQYLYRAADGTTYTFDTRYAYSTGSSNDFARIVSIVRPNSDSTTFAYNSYNVCVSSNGQSCTGQRSVYRLASLTRNATYRLELAYTTDTVSMPSQLNDFYNAASATVKNFAVTCDVSTAGACGTWPSATYGATTATDRLGGVANYQFSGGLLTGIQLPGSSALDVSISYNGNMVQSVTTPSTSTSYTYADNTGTNERTTTVTDGLGHASQTIFDLTSHLVKRSIDANNHVTTYVRDDRGRPTQVISPEGDTTKGYVAYTYDAYGNVLQKKIVPKDGSQPITTSATFACLNPGGSQYTDCANPSTTTDALGAVTNYTYDPSTAVLTAITYPAPAANAVRPQTRFLYSGLAPRVKNSTNALVYGPTVKVLTGISSCRTQSSCSGTDDENSTTIKRGTASDGSSQSVNSLDVSSVVQGSGTTTLAIETRYYDNIGNLTQSINGLGAETDFAYDNARQRTLTVFSAPDTSGTSRRRAIATHYDGRELVDYMALGSTDNSGGSFSAAQYNYATYDADRRKFTDRLSDGSTDYALTQYSYDAAGRPDCIATRMNPAAYGSLPASACTMGSPGSFGSDRITRSGYDAAGQPISTTVGYGLPNPIVTVAQTYSPDGMVASSTDADGNQTSYVYDGFDRLSQTIYPAPNSPGSSNPNDFEQRNYDANGNVTSRRLRDGQTIGYTYDALNRVTYEDNPNTNVAEVDVSYTYDNLGEITQASDQNGWQNSFTYDALGRITRQSSNVGGNNVQYDSASQPTGISSDDGFISFYLHDLDGQVTAIREGNNGPTLATYTYDVLGRRTGMSRSNGVTTTYSYDGASRLTQLAHDLSGTSQDVTFGFAYNPAGQIISRTSSNDAYAAQSHGSSHSYVVNGLNQYGSVDGTALAYDARGNLTQNGSASYQYNTKNQLFMNAAGQLLYHNPVGLLGQTPGINFDYLGKDLQIEANGSTLRRYVYGPGDDAPIAWYEGSDTSDRRYLLTDERGSVIAVTNGSGAALQINTYDEYGNPGSGNLGRFQYTGQKWLPEIGMYDYRARVYSPALGRFMQTDPIGPSDNPNLYAYAGNDPVNNIDPSGLQSCTPGFTMLCSTQTTSTAASTTSPSLSQLAFLAAPIASFLDSLFGSHKRTTAPVPPGPKPDRPQTRSQCGSSGPVIAVGPAIEGYLGSFGGGANGGGYYDTGTGEAGLYGSTESATPHNPTANGQGGGYGGSINVIGVTVARNVSSFSGSYETIGLGYGPVSVSYSFVTGHLFSPISGTIGLGINAGPPTPVTGHLAYGNTLTKTLISGCKP